MLTVRGLFRMLQNVSFIYSSGLPAAYVVHHAPFIFFSSSSSSALFFFFFWVNRQNNHSHFKVVFFKINFGIEHAVICLIVKRMATN